MVFLIEKYDEGPDAKKKFDEAMVTLFKASKPKKKEQEKPAPNERKTDDSDKG